MDHSRKLRIIILHESGKTAYFPQDKKGQCNSFIVLEKCYVNKDIDFLALLKSLTIHNNKMRWILDNEEKHDKTN